MVKSSDRTFALAELLARHRAGLTHAQLARALAMPKSSLTQLLQAAVRGGFVVLDAGGGRYRAGPRLRALAGLLARDGHDAADPWSDSLQEAVGHVAQATGEAASFAVYRGLEVHRVLVSQSRHRLAYRMEAGARFALHTTSTGKLLMATWSAAECAAYWRQWRALGVAAGTGRAHRGAAGLARELGEIRRTGVAYSVEEQTPGVVAIAVPVARDGRLAGAINVAMPRLRFTAAFEALCIEALQEAAARVHGAHRSHP